MRILLSGLGARPNKTSGDGYTEVPYEIEGRVYHGSSITRCLAQHFHPDKIFVVGTAKSMWYELYRSFTADSADFEENEFLQLLSLHEVSGKNDALPPLDVLDGLNRQLDRFCNHRESQCRMIHYGINAGELDKNMEIFMELAQGICDGDELYLDITHSFRSLAFFQMAMVSALGYLERRKFTIGGVFYGMLDIRNEMTDGIVPVVDIRPIFELNRWAVGIHEMRELGSTGIIEELLVDEPALQQKVASLGDGMDLLYVKEIKRASAGIVADMNSGILDTANFSKTYALGHVEKIARRLTDVDRLKMLRKLSRQLINNRRFSQASVALYESIMEYFFVLTARAFAPQDKDDRILQVAVRRTLNELAKKVNKKRGQQLSQPLQDLSYAYQVLRDIRNEGAHALGHRSGSSHKDVDFLKALDNRLEKLFFAMDSDLVGREFFLASYERSYAIEQNRG